MTLNRQTGWMARAALTAAVFLTLLGLLPAAAAAQEAPAEPTLEILAAEYDHATGEVLLSLRADGARDSTVENLTILVDSVPRSIVPRSETEGVPPTVLLAIDVSGSMEGDPIASAREAGAAFVEKLAEGDRVGLLTFSSAPELLVSPSSDHGQTFSRLAGLTPEGETALHDAIMLGLDTLGTADGERRALVLLSDGEDSGASAASAEQVLDAVAASGVSVYTFALGAGADTTFLAEVAARSGGSMWEVADDSALAEVFAALGGRLGATLELEVLAADLTASHSLEVRARVDGALASAEMTLDIPPASLTLGTPTETAPGEPIEIPVEGVPAGSALRASIDATPIEGVSADRVLVDPWLFAPGDYVVQVRAERGGEVIASGDKAVQVPELSPVLRVNEPAEAPETVEATLQWQGSGAPVLLASADGVEVDRTTEGFLSVPFPEGATQLEFSVLDGGAEVASEVFALPVASEASGSMLVLALAILLIPAAAGIVWFLRRRAKTKAQPVYRSVRRHAPPRLIEDLPTPPMDAGPMARLVLTSAAGEARIVPIGRRPLTVGSGPSCDVHIDGPEVRPQHARFTLTGANELRVHGIGGTTARPYEGSLTDQWLTLHPGDEIALGPWSMRFDDYEPQEEAS